MRPLFAFGSILLAGLLAQPRFNGSAQTEPLVSACVASYSRDSIVAAFGSQLTAATLVATDADPNTLGIQWPTMLGDVSVRVAGKLAPLFFVSPNQINYLVPPGLQIEQLDNGFATVEVANGNNVVASGRAQRVLAGLDQTNVQIPLEVRGKTAVLTGERGALEISATDMEHGHSKNHAWQPADRCPLYARDIGARPHYFGWLSKTAGVYQLNLTATDDDSQPLSVTQTVTLNLVASPEQNAWSTVTLPPFRFLLSFFADPSGVYLGLDTGTRTVQSTILRSTDNGASWTPYNNGLPGVNAPQRFAAGGNALYVGTQNGVWRSLNVNANWTEITNTLVAASKQVWELAARVTKWPSLRPPVVIFHPIATKAGTESETVCEWLLAATRSLSARILMACLSRATWGDLAAGKFGPKIAAQYSGIVGKWRLPVCGLGQV